MSCEKLSLVYKIEANEGAFDLEHDSVRIQKNAHSYIFRIYILSQSRLAIVAVTSVGDKYWPGKSFHQLLK